MKITIYSISLFFHVLNLCAQDKSGVLIPYLSDGKYGFADEDGKLVLKAKYDAAFPFYEDYALTTVFKNGKAFIINRKGKVIKRGSSDFFHKKNFINMHFHFPDELRLSYAKRFCQLDSCPEFEIIEAPEDRILFDKMSGLYFVSNQKKVYLMNENGKAVSEYYDRIRHYNFNELEFCLTEDLGNIKYGLLDNEGKVLLNCV